MTLDIKIVLIFGVAVWLLFSYWTYVTYSLMAPEDRDWTDDTRAKRIFWVFTGPIFWIVAIVWSIGEVLHRRIRRYKSRAVDRRIKRDERREKREDRRRNFLSDPKNN